MYEVFFLDKSEQIYFLFYFILPFHTKRNEKWDSFYTAKRVSSCHEGLSSKPDSTSLMCILVHDMHFTENPTCGMVWVVGGG